jgi:hypothetical protein
MSNNPFKPLKDRKSTFSNHPKTMSNRRSQKQKRGLDIAVHRVESNFRVRKSRALKKLATGKEWASLAPSKQESMKDAVIAQLIEQKEALKAEIEREWFKKVDAGEIEEDEDDMMVLDEEVDSDPDDDDDAADGDGENMEEVQFSNQGELIVEDDGAWNEEDDWESTDDEESIATLASDMAALKAKSGKGWQAIMNKIVEKAERKLAL